MAAFLLQPGCAAVMVEGPPDDWEQLEDIDCRKRVPAIAADAAVLAGSLIVMVLSVSGDTKLEGAEWAIPASTAVASGGSLVWGLRKSRACNRAKRELRRRREERMWQDDPAALEVMLDEQAEVRSTAVLGATEPVEPSKEGEVPQAPPETVARTATEPVHGQEPEDAGHGTIGAISGQLAGLSDLEVRRRTRFITDRLEDGEFHAELWQYGFTSGYSLGVILGATQAAINDDPGDRASALVTMVKGVGGVARMVFDPNPGRTGSKTIYEIPGTTAEERLERLIAAEELLHEVETVARKRHSFKRHFMNFVVNLAGGGIVYAFGDWEDALESFAVGVFVGEIQIFTQPNDGIVDADEYRTEFSPFAHEPELSWRIRPNGAGAAIELTF